MRIKGGGLVGGKEKVLDKQHRFIVETMGRREGRREGGTYRRALGGVGVEDAGEEVLGGFRKVGSVALVRLPEPIRTTLLWERRQKKKKRGGKEGGIWMRR